MGEGGAPRAAGLDSTSARVEVSFAPARNPCRGATSIDFHPHSQRTSNSPIEVAQNLGHKNPGSKAVRRTARAVSWRGRYHAADDDGDYCGTLSAGENFSESLSRHKALRHSSRQGRVAASIDAIDRLLGQPHGPPRQWRRRCSSFNSPNRMNSSISVTCNGMRTY
jgi:hypothetical protein